MENKRKSILHNRSQLTKRISEVAEVAGYLWEKGWAERNGGNITLNITDEVDDEIKNLKAISSPIEIGETFSHLKGTFFYCKGTQKRMRDLARYPMDNGSIIRICPDCASYEIIADAEIMPTSELPSHLAMHNYLIGKGTTYKAAIHTHPTDLIAMSHHSPFLKKDVLTNILWSMIPETRAFCPRGLGVVPYELPSSIALAKATVDQLADYDVVLWEKHGVCAVGENIMEAFDQIDTLSKSAQIYLIAQSMGFSPEGMSNEQMKELKDAFNLPK